MTQINRYVAFIENAVHSFTIEMSAHSLVDARLMADAYTMSPEIQDEAMDVIAAEWDNDAEPDQDDTFYDVQLVEQWSHIDRYGWTNTGIHHRSDKAIAFISEQALRDVMATYS